MAFALSFASDGKTASKMHEMLKQLSVTMLWEEHRLVNAFFSSNVRKLQLKFQSVHVVPPQVADENMEKLRKIVNKQ
jgi:hypothetical protein